MKRKFSPPKARKEPKLFKKFDHTRIDNYYWLRHKENQEVIDYLNLENEYYNKETSNTKKFQNELFEEIKNKIKELYERAYETWTEKEIKILKVCFLKCHRIETTAKLLKRQPSAVEKKLKFHGLIS